MSSFASSPIQDDMDDGFIFYFLSIRILLSEILHVSDEVPAPWAELLIPNSRGLGGGQATRKGESDSDGETLQSHQLGQP